MVTGLKINDTNITILLRVMLHMYAAIEAKCLNEGRVDASEIVL